MRQQELDDGDVVSGGGDMKRGTARGLVLAAEVTAPQVQQFDDLKVAVCRRHVKWPVVGRIL